MSGPVVVKIGGAGVEEPREGAALWRALAEAHRLLGGQLLLVHGGGRAVDRHLERLGHRTERIDGLRVTPPEQAAEIAAVLAGRINKALVAALLAEGIRAVGLCLSDGGALRCTRHPNSALGQVGIVAGGDGGLLRTLLAAGYLPVMSSVALDEAGGFLNVNADDAAAGVAAVLSARSLILLSDVDGIRGPGDGGVPIGTIDAAGIEFLITSGVISGGMIPKARAAATAAARAAAPAYIASFMRPADVLRIVRGEPAGTRVLPPGEQPLPTRA
ncbi:MAG: acetylglutamate kinase [Phycisphaerales bacterium]